MARRLILTVVLLCASVVLTAQTPVDKFVDVNGLRLHYLDWGGSGPLLVLVTAWTGTRTCSTTWRRTSPRAIA